MKPIRSAAVLVLVMISAVPPCAAQDAAAAPPGLTREQIERFLLTAEIVSTRGTTKGVTNARRVTLSDGRLEHDAQVQSVDIAMPIFDVGPRHTEINFRDTYRYNIAAYRLSLLLGLDNVPVSVERTVDGKPAAMTWWLDNVALEEGQRQKKKIAGPDPSRTASQLHILRVFDELIQNRDRNAGNLLWTSDWKMWMIDHTRAFRLGRNLLKPDQLDRCERTLFEKLRELTASSIGAAMGAILKKDETEALLARRDRIVQIFEKRIAERGEAVVLYTLGQ